MHRHPLNASGLSGRGAMDGRRMSSGPWICWGATGLTGFTRECDTSRRGAALQVLNENWRGAKNESMRIVSQAKTT